MNRLEFFAQITDIEETFPGEGGFRGFTFEALGAVCAVCRGRMSCAGAPDRPVPSRTTLHAGKGPARWKTATGSMNAHHTHVSTEGCLEDNGNSTALTMVESSHVCKPPGIEEDFRMKCVCREGGQIQHLKGEALQGQGGKNMHLTYKHIWHRNIYLLCRLHEIVVLSMDSTTRLRHHSQCQKAHVRKKDISGS